MLMKSRFRAAALVLGMASCVFAFNSPSAKAEAVGEKHALVANGDHFELDGKRFQIISGAIHYARVPRAYWRDRFRKARAMGLNTIETYVFWNKHETAPGVYDFSGQNDIAEFVREAQEEGLFVILRPGPYVCAEWEFGGYPAWLLREPGMQVRSSNAAFMAAASQWMHRLGKELAPLQSANGGPIIAVQVENEYGSYGADHAYMEQVHKLILDSGFDKAMLYTADGADEVQNGSLPELPVAINFGTGDAKAELAKLDKLRPNGPRMCGEYWSGWFDHWGGKHAHTDEAAEAADLKWMLQQGYSVNLYMFHGGTSFGWMNGANSDGKNYEPDVTSYDYDSPVSEDGSLGRKFALFRDVIESVTGVKPPAPPPAVVAHAMHDIALKQGASLWENLPKPIVSEQTRTMEEVGQSYGYILYRTQVPKTQNGLLHIDQLHSYAQVFIDGKVAGTIDRRLNQTELKIDATHDHSRLDILVENTGRVNYGKQLGKEQAGITHEVLLNGAALKGWSIYPLPMLDVNKLDYKSQSCTGDCFYKADFDVTDVADTFVETGGFTKGEVWINGQPLGRFWSVGPQKTLYLPAPWLKMGRNEIVVFDTVSVPNRALHLTGKPDLGDVSK